MKYLAEGINLKKGVQHLNGEDALAYVRYRGDALADIARTERQQKFLKAFAEEMFKTKTILKIPSLLPELKKNVETNMGTKTMLELAKLALKFSPGDLVAQTLPGYFYDDPNTGASYWIVDKTKSRELIASLMDGRKVAVIQESPYPVVKTPWQEESRQEQRLKTRRSPGTGEAEEPGDGLTRGCRKNPARPGGDAARGPRDPGQVEEPVIPNPVPGNNLGPEGYV